MNPPIASQARIVLIILSVLTSRIFFLHSGYGSDPDAWRVAFASQTLWNTGEYIASRFPGYPLHEITMAPIVAMGGSLATNALTLLAFTVATVLWYAWSKRHMQYPLVLTIGFAFFPLGWVASMTTMDYAWSLLFLVASMLAASRSKSVLAGILLGVAAGFRPSNIVFWVVVAFLLRASGKNSIRSIASMGAASVMTLLLAFLPVFSAYGLEGWWQLTSSQVEGVTEPALDRLLLAAYRAVYAIGPLAVIMLIGLLIQRWAELYRRSKLPDDIMLGAISGCLVFGVIFLLLPAERSYLLPVILCILIIVDRLASQRGVVIIVILIVSYAFVNPDVVHHKGRRGVPGFDLRPGVVLEEVEKRNVQLKRREFLSTADLGDSTLVMVGSSAPMWVDNDRFETNPEALTSTLIAWDIADVADRPARRTDGNSSYVVSVLAKEDILRARSAGFSVACLDDVREYAEWVGGFECEKDSVRVIGTAAFW